MEKLGVYSCWGLENHQLGAPADVFKGALIGGWVFREAKEKTAKLGGLAGLHGPPKKRPLDPVGDPKLGRRGGLFVQRMVSLEGALSSKHAKHGQVCV